MPRWFKIILGLIGTAALACVGFFVLLITGFIPIRFDLSNMNSDSHWDARAAFLADIDITSCVSRDAIHAAARANDFESWDVEGDFAACHTPAGLRDHMGVEVRPGQMMSTRDENTEYFGFDGNTCAVVITYDTGPDSTCPE